MTIPRENWEWYGSAGHFIMGNRCRFHLATVIGQWLVSTVGECVANEGDKDFYEIGYERKYETMVFRVGSERCAEPACECGLPIVEDWGDLDMDGYNVRGDAQRGHYAMCDKWAARTTDEVVA